MYLYPCCTADYDIYKNRQESTFLIALSAGREYVLNTNESNDGDGDDSSCKAIDTVKT